MGGGVEDVVGQCRGVDQLLACPHVLCARILISLPNTALHCALIPIRVGSVACFFAELKARVVERQRVFSSVAAARQLLRRRYRSALPSTTPDADLRALRHRNPWVLALEALGRGSSSRQPSCLDRMRFAHPSSICSSRYPPLVVLSLAACRTRLLRRSPQLHSPRVPRHCHHHTYGIAAPNLV